MADHIEFLRRQAGAESVRAAAQGSTRAMVVTDQEVICGRVGLLGRFGNRVDRYALARLSNLGVLPNPSALMLQLRFVAPDEEVNVLFPASSRRALDGVVGALRAGLPQAVSGGGR